MVTLQNPLLQQDRPISPFKPVGRSLPIMNLSGSWVKMRSACFCGMNSNEAQQAAWRGCESRRCEKRYWTLLFFRTTVIKVCMVDLPLRIFMRERGLKTIRAYWITWEAQSLRQTFFAPLKPRKNSSKIV